MIGIFRKKDWDESDRFSKEILIGFKQNLKNARKTKKLISSKRFIFIYFNIILSFFRLQIHPDKDVHQHHREYIDLKDYPDPISSIRISL